MSLTQTQHVFAGIAESDIYAFLNALFTILPRTPLRADQATRVQHPF